MHDDKERLYKALLQRYEDIIVGVCQRYCRNDSYHYAALYGEVTFVLWREWQRYGLSRLRRRDRLASWVHRVASNVAIDYMRRNDGHLSCISLSAAELDTLLPPSPCAEGEWLDEILASPRPHAARPPLPRRMAAVAAMGCADGRVPAVGLASLCV